MLLPTWGGCGRAEGFWVAKHTLSSVSSFSSFQRAGTFFHKQLARGSLVVPFCGSYLGSYEVIPKNEQTLNPKP